MLLVEGAIAGSPSVTSVLGAWIGQAELRLVPDILGS